MNKSMILGLSAFAAVFLSACGLGGNRTQTAAETTLAQTETAAETHTEKQMEAADEAEDLRESDLETETGQETKSEILIAYFSRVGNTDFGEGVDAASSASVQLREEEIAGNTELLAGMIQEYTGGDLFLIETAGKYPAGYDDVLDAAQAEGREKARPVLSSHVEDMDKYEIVFLGYPNWWGDCPMAVYSFLEEYDFSGKTVIPFSTSGGSGLSGTVSAIRGILADSEVLDGFTVRDSGVSDAGTAVADWVSGLDILD